jgi:ribonucleoside-diphosphate reductase alpha chain
MLDNLLDVSDYPLAEQAEESRAKRRIGLGITGLADALIFCGARYGTEEAAALAQSWMRTIQNAAYRTSAALAGEKGAFPMYDAAAMLGAHNLQRLDPEVRAAIGRHGLRNGCLTSIAPTGTISLLAGNVSSGIEPVFDFDFTRRIRAPDGTIEEHRVRNFAMAMFEARTGGRAPTGDAFVTVRDLSPDDHLVMQAALQPWVDSSISKTINCPEALGFEAFKDIYLRAYDLGLKGCTTFRPNPVTGSVLEASGGAAPPDAASPEPHDPPRDDRVVYLAKPVARDQALAGRTYKLRWPGAEHAYYVTINDVVQDGRRRPFEIFINSRNLDDQGWIVALTRMISAIFRRGGDVRFIAGELQAIVHPRAQDQRGGHAAPSLLAAIGSVIDQHLSGLRDELAETGALREPVPVNAGGSNRLSPSMPQRAARVCPECGSSSLVPAEGCWMCETCGFSTCG